MKFYQLYSEALGSIIGMIVCIYCYINGTLTIYSNLSGNYDSLTFSQVIGSYLLFPLCILTFIIAVWIASYPGCDNKKILGARIKNVNIFFKYLTIIIGLLGCTIYFIAPAFFMILGDVISFIKNIVSKLHNHINLNKKEAAAENELNPILMANNKADDKLISTKLEIAIHLLNKDADMAFIQDITGLSTNELNRLKEEALNLQAKS